MDDEICSTYKNHTTTKYLQFFEKLSINDKLDIINSDTYSINPFASPYLKYFENINEAEIIQKCVENGNISNNIIYLIDAKKSKETLQIGEKEASFSKNIDDIIHDLNSVKTIESKTNLLYLYSNNINKEIAEKILDTCNPEEKASFISELSKHLNIQDYIKYFKQISDEEQEKNIIEFSRYFLGENAEENYNLAVNELQATNIGLLFKTSFINKSGKYVYQRNKKQNINLELSDLNNNYLDLLKQTKRPEDFHSILKLMNRQNIELNTAQFQKLYEIHKDTPLIIDMILSYNRELQLPFETKIELLNNNIYSFSLKENLNLDEIKKQIMQNYKIIDVKNRMNYFSSIIKNYINSFGTITKSPFGDLTNISEEKEKKAKSKITNYLESMLYDDSIDINNKYLITSLTFSNLIPSQYDISQKKSIYKDSNEIGEKYLKYLDSISGRKYFEIYNKLLNSYFIVQQEDPEYIKNIALQETINLLPYIENEKTYNTIIDLQNKNNAVLQNLSPKLLSSEIIEFLDDNLLDVFLKFGNYNSSDIIEDIVKDKEKCMLFYKSYELISEYKEFPEENILSLLDKFSSREFNASKIKAENNLPKFIIDSIYNYDDKKMSKEECDNQIYSGINTLKTAKDAFFKRFFYITYDEVEMIIHKYGKDINYFIDKYKQNTNLTDEEFTELNSLLTIQNFKEIMNITDKNAIIQTYKELSQDKMMCDIDYMARFGLEESAKRVYSKDYIDCLYKPDEKDKTNINGTTVYNPKNFNFLVHIVGAFSNFSIINNNESAKDIWNSKINNTNHILCTSFINQSCLCHYKDINDKSIILGFNNVGKNSINMAAPYDIASIGNTVSSQYSIKKFSFRNKENLIFETRALHNEIDIERRIDKTDLKRIQPDYVICYDKINKQSKKVAKDFNVPIVYINTRELAKNEHNEISNMINVFNKEVDSSLISKIINRYEGNIISFSTTRKKLAKKYFSPNEMTINLESMINSITQLKDSGNTDKYYECLNEFKRVLLEEERKFKTINAETYLFNSNTNFDFLKIKEQINSLINKERNNINENSFRIKYKFDNSTLLHNKNNNNVKQLKINETIQRIEEGEHDETR